jgi:uncharacterized protein YkwD
MNLDNRLFQSGWSAGVLIVTSLGFLALAQPLAASTLQAKTIPNHNQAPTLPHDFAQPPGPQRGVLEELLALVNAERQKGGLPPLILDAQLNQAAQRHAQDLANQGNLNHTGSDGSTMQSRIEATGYSWTAIGENIAMGQTTPQAVMTSWMGSSGHRQNIVNPAFSEIGLGYVEDGGTKYWVQVFATPR